MDRVSPQKSKFFLPAAKEGIEELLSEKIDKEDFARIILVDSPLSGNLIDEYEEGLAVLRSWLKERRFKLVFEKGFDYDRTAPKKRKYLNRPFPDFRTTVHIYERLAR